MKLCCKRQVDRRGPGAAGVTKQVGGRQRDDSVAAFAAEVINQLHLPPTMARCKVAKICSMCKQWRDESDVNVPSSRLALARDRFLNQNLANFLK